MMWDDMIFTTTVDGWKADNDIFGKLINLFDDQQDTARNIRQLFKSCGAEFDIDGLAKSLDGLPLLDFLNERDYRYITPLGKIDYNSRTFYWNDDIKLKLELMLL